MSRIFSPKRNLELLMVGLDRVIDVSFNPPISPIYAHEIFGMKFHADTEWLTRRLFRWFKEVMRQLQ